LLFLLIISDGEHISAHLLLSTLSILTTLDVYYPVFADQLVQSTQTYYAKEAETLSNTKQPAEYIAHVDARLEQEASRCDRYFERQSKKEVLTVVQEELIAHVSETIMERGFNNLVKDNDIDSLRTLYRLLSLVDQVDIMHSAWSDYIKVFLSKTPKRKLIPGHRCRNSSASRTR
jgi:transcriptional regulator of heat shock response